MLEATERPSLPHLSRISCRLHKTKHLIVVQYSTRQGKGLLVSELLISKANKEARKTKHDFNPLPRIETSSIRVSWRKPGLHRASPFLRDFPSSFASLQKAACDQAAFLFFFFTDSLHSHGDNGALGCI